MKKSLTVYLPNGDIENFELGKHAEKINLLNNNLVEVVCNDGLNLVFSGIPFIYRYELEVGT
ncbi:MAG: hypothetical protein LBU85_08810 [Treponema sp.]|jgi:hypothetical protein|nr:hypothetical protein [Treponema sp.]